VVTHYWQKRAEHERARLNRRGRGRQWRRRQMAIAVNVMGLRPTEQPCWPDISWSLLRPNGRSGYALDAFTRAAPESGVEDTTVGRLYRIEDFGAVVFRYDLEFRDFSLERVLHVLMHDMSRLRKMIEQQIGKHVEIPSQHLDHTLNFAR
jgi:hypothetical protein